MPITPDDIKLVAAERLTDEPDGGGRLTATVLQSGVDNNLFDDVDDFDRVTGKTSLRKAGVVVVSTDTNKYGNARVLISKIPADETVHGVLFEPSFDDDVRSDATARVAGYLAPGGTYSGYLFGDHLAGMATVILLQRVETPLPPVGGVLYLVANEKLANQKSQYVRITDVTDVIRTFSSVDGDFQRRQVTLSIGEPLDEEFAGFEATKTDASMNYVGKTRLREVIVADSAQYYSTKRLAEPAVLGSRTVKVDSIFEQLVPASQIDTPIVNADPAPPANLAVGSGAQVSYVENASWSAATNLQLPGPCLPGSFVVEVGAGQISDKAGAVMLAGEQIGTIDYANGTASLVAGVFNGAKTVRYQPAGTALRAPQSTGRPVTIANRSGTVTAILSPPPVPGSLSFAYRSGGRWYTLTDDGSGAVRGSSAAFGAGQVDHDSGGVAITMGALPDVGSTLIWTWSAATQETRWPVATLKASMEIDLPLLAGESAQPGTVVISWPAQGGGTHTSTDAALVGTLAGNATGKVKYATGKAELVPALMPPVGALVTVSCHAGAKRTDAFAHPARNGVGQVPVTASLGAIVPGSLEVEWNTLTDLAVLGVYTATQLRQAGIGGALVDPTHIARDDGAGHVVLNGSTVGAVNYATGEVWINPDVTIKIPRPNYSVGEGLPTFNPVGNPAVNPRTLPTTRWRINYDGITYVDALSVYPLDDSGHVTLRYNSEAGNDVRTGTVTFAPKLALTGDVQPTLLAGALVLRVGTEVIGDNGSGKLRTLIAGAWLERGSVSYVSASATLTSWPAGAANAFERLSCLSAVGSMLSADVVFRTAIAPLRNEGFLVRFSSPEGDEVIVNVDADGNLFGDGVIGSIKEETGVCELLFGAWVTAAGNEAEPWYNASAIVNGKIWKPMPILLSSLRYTATAYTYLPLPADMVGLETVRLPQDGRVPVFKKARVILVFHTGETAPANVGNGGTIDTGRTMLAWAEVYDANGAKVTTGFTANLDTGIVTFTNVAGMAMPVKVRSRIETESLAHDVQIDGTITLLRPLAHNYPAGETLVASVMGGTTLQAGVTQGWSQATWTNEWADARIGNPITAQYDEVAHPISVNNRGAINQRWAFIFTSPTAFRVVGETRGEVITGNTMSTCAPINPDTGEPYFSISPAGWGGGWAQGDVYRSNTRGARLPFWAARTVEQSEPGQPGTTQIEYEVRGSLNAEA